jgi:heat shock protein HtpX
MINIYEAIDANKRKSAIIIIAFVVFITLATYVFSQAFGAYYGYRTGGLGFVGIAFIISGLMSIGSYYFSDKIVLAISGAKPANRKRDFTFYTVVENLSIATGLPKPKAYVIEDTAPNAFATGRDPDHAVICATRGLLDKLTRTELEGVIAHELSHIRHYDIRLAGIVTVLVGLIALLGDMFLRASWMGRRGSNRRGSQLDALFIILGLLFAILAPIIAKLIQLAISRRREFMADAGAIALTRQPQGLISALEKISKDKEPLEVANKATAHFYIVNPFKGRSHGALNRFSGLFNTHPPVAERIKTLKNMA